MNKRNDLLNVIARRNYRETSPFDGTLCRLNEEALHAILESMAKYYEINDIETSDNHSRIFKTLYLDNKRLSYDEVAEMYHIHVYTLDRYRQRYNRLAEKFVAEAINKTATERQKINN